jgi:polysaccharide pyruvyl transferase CsaB
MVEGPLQIAVSGYYGCGNTGDEAVLAGIVESFRLRKPDQAIEFTVLSADPADTERRHGLKAVRRMNQAALAETFRSSDLVLSGGGSLLQDTTSLRSLIYYLWVVRLAQRHGAPVMFYAQGIGPLRRSVSRSLTRMVANRVAGITVRDPESAKLLRSIGVTRPAIEVTADPAFALSPATEDRIDSIMERSGIDPGERPIGLALRPWPAMPSVAEWSKLARTLNEKTGRRLLFLPMQHPADLELARSIRSVTDAPTSILEKPLSPADTLGVVSRMDLLVGMRLHALIFAAAMGVPVMALAYDPKVTQLMHLVGQSERCFILTDSLGNDIAEAAKSTLNTGEDLRAELRKRSAELREKALQNVDYALLAMARRM